MTGSSLCQLISSDPIVNHSGVVTVMVYPETDATYTNCSMLVRDRANNSSNTLTLTTFSYIQPPFRLHLMM